MGIVLLELISSEIVLQGVGISSENLVMGLLVWPVESLPCCRLDLKKDG